MNWIHSKIEKSESFSLGDYLKEKEFHIYLNQFLLHVEECPECMEELTIQYLVMIGTSLIEEGKSFNLRKALNELLLEAWKAVQKWKILVLASYIAEVITLIVMAIILIVVIFV